MRAYYHKKEKRTGTFMPAYNFKGIQALYADQSFMTWPTNQSLYLYVYRKVGHVLMKDYIRVAQVAQFLNDTHGHCSSSFLLCMAMCNSGIRAIRRLCLIKIKCRAKKKSRRDPDIYNLVRHVSLRRIFSITLGLWPDINKFLFYLLSLWV